MTVASFGGRTEGIDIRSGDKMFPVFVRFALFSQTLTIASIVIIMFTLGRRGLANERRFWRIVFGLGIGIGNLGALIAVFGISPPLVLIAAGMIALILSLIFVSKGRILSVDGQIATAKESRPIHLALLPTAIPALVATALWWVSHLS